VVATRYGPAKRGLVGALSRSAAADVLHDDLWPTAQELVFMTSAFLRRFRHRGLDLNTRAVVALAVIVLVSQAIGVAEPEARPWILAASVPLLDLLGAFYSAKAARRSGQLSWWLTAAARGASVLTTLLLFGHVITGNELWWWAGTCCRLVMFGARWSPISVRFWPVASCPSGISCSAR
jgi:hypothetical protein